MCFSPPPSPPNTMLLGAPSTVGGAPLRHPPFVGRAAGFRGLRPWGRPCLTRRHFFSVYKFVIQHWRRGVQGGSRQSTLWPRWRPRPRRRPPARRLCVLRPPAMRRPPARRLCVLSDPGRRARTGPPAAGPRPPGALGPRPPAADGGAPAPLQRTLDVSDTRHWMFPRSRSWPDVLQRDLFKPYK